MNVYQIAWNSGSKSASLYSSKKLAEDTLKNARYKGKIIKIKLPKPGYSPLLREPLVWVKDKVKYGFVYRSRAISALQKAEKSRVVKMEIKK